MNKKLPIVALLLVVASLVFVILAGAETISADSLSEESEPEIQSTKSTCGSSGSCVSNCGCGCRGNPNACGCGK